MAKFLDEVGAQYLVDKVKALVPDITAVYRYKGSKETFAEVEAITEKEVGDVYNVVQADPTNGVAAGTNVAWTGTEWDPLGGTFDISSNVPTTPITNEEIDAMFIASTPPEET